MHPRILHVMCSKKQGGAETFCPELICGLHQAGCVQHVVLCPGSPNVSMLRAAGIPVTTTVCRGAWDRIFTWKLKNLIKSFQPGIVQTWVRRASHLCPKLKKAQGPVHLSWYGGYYPAKYFRNTHHAIGITPNVCSHIQQSLNLPAECVHHIPIMADLPSPLPPPLPRDTFSTPQDVPLLLCLSRLSEEKGVDVLLRALRDVPRAILWIAGTGREEHALKKLTKDLEVDSRVRWLGWQSDRAALLQAADMFVFPSRSDSFGAVMIEAWQTRTPLVACAAPGPSEIATHEHDALLCRVDHPRELSQAINRLLDAPHLRDKLTRNGFQHYEACFSKDRVISAYYDLYAQIV